jgi:hypothetical protein
MVRDSLRASLGLAAETASPQSSAYVVGDQSRVLESDALQRPARKLAGPRPLSVPPGGLCESARNCSGPVVFSASAYLRPSAGLSRPHAAEVHRPRRSHAAEVRGMNLARAGPTPARCRASPLDWSRDVSRTFASIHRTHGPDDISPPGVNRH